MFWMPIAFTYIYVNSLSLSHLRSVNIRIWKPLKIYNYFQNKIDLGGIETQG